MLKRSWKHPSSSHPPPQTYTSMFFSRCCIWFISFFLHGNGVPCSPLFPFTLLVFPSFLSLNEVSCGNYFDQYFQMQSFPPFFFVHSNSIDSVICFLCLYRFLSLWLFFNPSYFLLQIPTGGHSWRGRRGRGQGLILGCVSPGFSVVLFKFPWCECNCHWWTISLCRSRQPAVEQMENSLWWFPLLHWHSFTAWLSLPIHQSALIFTRRHLALS